MGDPQEITVSDAINMQMAIGALKQRGIHLDARLSYKLGRLRTRLEPINSAYEEARQQLVKAHGTEDEDGSISVKADSDHYNQFVEELKALLDAKELVRMPSFSIEEFDGVKGVPIEFFEALGGFISD